MPNLKEPLNKLPTTPLPYLGLRGLMHDAAAAHLGDVPTLLKKGSFEDLELKRSEMQFLVDEKNVVMGTEPKPW